MVERGSSDSEESNLGRFHASLCDEAVVQRETDDSAVGDTLQGCVKLGGRRPAVFQLDQVECVSAKGCRGQRVEVVFVGDWSSGGYCCATDAWDGSPVH
jgi:hypothetical protein